jgi:WD40 repeat protein
LFSSEQETYLGDIVAEHLQSSSLVIDEDDVNDYLRNVAARVVRQLAPTDIHYQFFLYDQPQIQAFGLPGGRVYVSRKLVAFLRSEDELAGVLGHELGHIVMHQASLRISAEMRQSLGIQVLGDREDVYEKYNLFLESYRLKKIRTETRSESDRDQMVADRIGIEATARAGYSPQALVDALDRIMQTKGKTGNWLSDLFGTTQPDTRRLREVLEDVSGLPAACVDPRPRDNAGEFHHWQDVVLHYHGIGHKEQLRNLLAKQTLHDPIRPDIDNFRFSPDGKYIVAQDEGGVSVLTRDPLALKFHFDSPHAAKAQFSTDSREITFATRDFRVESWNVASQERSSLTDVAVLHGCSEMELSPDGKFLACFSAGRDLVIYDVISGQEIFRKDPFFDPDVRLVGAGGTVSFFMRLLMGEGITTLRFSSDSHYFSGVAPGSDPVVLELPEARKISVSGAIRDSLRWQFCFLGSDRLVGVNPYSPDKSSVYQFPGGARVTDVPLGDGILTAATNPRYLLIHPIKDNPLGVMDLQTQKLILASRNTAMDLWNDLYVNERRNGEVGLYKVQDGKLTSAIQLPIGNLGGLAAYAVSPDLHWMAISARTRGAVFDLQKNERLLFTRGFRSCYSVSPEIFYLQFRKSEKLKPEIVAFSGATHQSAERFLEENDDLVLRGKISIRRKRGEKMQANRNVTFEAVETEKGNVLWSRTFPKLAPTLEGSHSPGRLVLAWPANSDGAKEETALNPALKTKFDLKSTINGDYFLEVVDSSTGDFIGAAVVRTGKGAFLLRSADSVGDWLILSDNDNRILLYSLSTGEVKARFFGTAPMFSSNGALLSVANDRGQLRIYDLHTLRQLDDLAFSSPIIMDAFSADAQKLLVLTSDQTVYTLDMSRFCQKPATAPFQ